MDQKRSKNLKRVVSGLLSLAMITTSMSAVLPASADEASRKHIRLRYLLPMNRAVLSLILII